MEEQQPQQQNPFEMTTEQMDEKFELIINHFKSKSVLRRADFLMGALKAVKSEEIIERMRGYELLIPYVGVNASIESYVLTRYGYEVLRAGGWKQYHKDKTKHEKLIRDQVESTIDTNKFQKYVLYLTLALTLGTFILSWDTNSDNRELLKLETARFEREQKQQPIPVVNPNVNVTLKRDTIVLVQPAKSKK